MASGTGERPTLDYNAERSFLELGGWKSMIFEISANTNKYIYLPRNASALRTGMFWLLSSNASRNGYYMYARGTGSTGTIILTPIKDVTQSGMSVAVNGDYIAITGSTGYVYGVIAYFSGGKPEVVSTLPT